MTTSKENSFVFYQSFFDMIECIPDVQTQMMAYKTICDYALRGVVPQTDNWVIQMVFCAVKPQIDANKKRRENGKKGGRKAAQPDTAEQVPQVISMPATQPMQATEPAAISTPATQPMQATEPAAVSTPTTQRNGVFPYGKNEYPVTQAELDKFAAFTKKLFDDYRGGAAPSEADIEKVIELTNVRKEIGNTAIAVFDWDKYDLLHYAFEQADAVGKLNWCYIDGMYRRFDQRDIVTGADARQYDFMRHAQAL